MINTAQNKKKDDIIDILIIINALFEIENQKYKI